MSHELTDVFRDRVEYSDAFKTRLAAARKKPKDQAIAALKAIAEELDDPKNTETGVLIDLYLSYRAVGAYDEMIALYEAMPAEAKVAAVARQQLAFALNRRNAPGDRDRAVSVLQDLLQEQGDSAETLGLLGRIYKDQYREAGGGLMARGLLNRAIEAYTRGFEAEPLDYYPGVNAINLLLQKGDEEAIAEIDRLSPLVTFAAVRHGGEKASDYWTVATVLELASVSRDYGLASRCAANALALADEPWMYETTAQNLRLIVDLRKDESEIERLQEILDALIQAAAQMRGESD
jgi:tetratricopeptide (TPR) repeat protein